MQCFGFKFYSEVHVLWEVHKSYFFQMDYDNTFNCSGKVNFNDWQLSNTSLFSKEVENIFLPKRDHSFSDVQVKLFDCFVPGATAILNLKHFINCME